MSRLLFLDESGHDHNNMQFEVRGGVAVPVDTLWRFIRSFQDLEMSCFGCHLHDYKTEIKGHKLLHKDRFKWAAQGESQSDEDRASNCVQFLEKGLRKQSPKRHEMTAYGQACLLMAEGIFQLLADHDANIFASAIPRGQRLENDAETEWLRKDHVFLLERFYYSLEAAQKHGILVMDETEKTADRRFVRKLQNYFTKTHTGRQRSSWIVPSPFFVASDMASPVQAADVCIYAVNACYRAPGFEAPVREDVRSLCLPAIERLQWHGDGRHMGKTFRTHGIVFMRGEETKKEAKLLGSGGETPRSALGRSSVGEDIK